MSFRIAPVPLLPRLISNRLPESSRAALLRSQLQRSIATAPGSAATPPAASAGAPHPMESVDDLRQASEGYAGPVEQTIKRKLVDLLNPTVLKITNDSHLHSHHAAMRAQGGGSGETHFSVLAVSAAFEGKRQMQRHRMIYAALDEELKAHGGVHALALQTRTPAEADRTLTTP